MPRSVRDEILGQRRFRQLGVLLALSAVVIGLSTVHVERGQGYFTSYEDGLWWAVTTISSVGYGDLVPVTSLGRLLGALLQLIGVISMGLIVGIITHSVSRRQEEIFWSREFERFNQIEKRLLVMEKHLQYLIRERFDLDERREESREKSPNSNSASAAAVDRDVKA